VAEVTGRSTGNDLPLVLIDLKVTTTCKGRIHTREETSPTDKICLASRLQLFNAHRVFGGHGWTRGRVMTGLVNSPIAQYAVIEAGRTEGPSERFVIAYPDEESLRELIAGPSIIACGFANGSGS
jgi:hypothetical protein